jgi:hypothetical protein
LAALALRMFQHVDPRDDDASDGDHELASAGALLQVELIASARAQLQTPMQICFPGAGPVVELYNLDSPNGEPSK